ncbi:MAG TPA: c-type cytochrome domain-containing protein, partial [Hymenobacter sp.]|nr:c-type cytochrome domain-containing protein [Hymenobacter sp.]
MKNSLYLLSIVAGIGWLSPSCTTDMGNRMAYSNDGSGHMPDKVSYNFDIRPILSDKCLACHGPDANKREAGLRLDMAESAYKAL